MPDTAVGSDLDRLAAQYGLSRRINGPSTGHVVLSTSANTYIPAGQQLVDRSGLRYEVTTGGIYTNTDPGNLVPILAIDAGYATNHEANDVLRWTSTPAYAAPTAYVATAGLAGGVDAEDDEALRARFLSRLQNPPNNSNWSQIAVFSEESSTTVQKAFLYPAVNGPSTCHVVVVAAPQVLTPSITTLNATSKNRDISTADMTGTIAPYILGQMPEYVETVTTTVVNQPNDVGIGLSLPAAPTATPAGPGGGWVDATPWPQPQVGGVVDVSAVTSALVFNVSIGDVMVAPTANVSHICRLDPTTWVLQRAMVTAVTVSFTSYTITIDTPFTNVAVGDYIWPDCVRAQDYVDAILGAFALMGPGEKTTNTGNLTRGYRHPMPAHSWPYTLGASQLRAITNVGDEVLDVSWISRTSSTAPTVDAAVANPPSIFVPRQIAFYKIAE